MLFGSVEFILYFLPIFLILYGLTPQKYKNLSLLTGSLIFYAFGDPQYFLLLFLSLIVNYCTALRIRKKQEEDDKYRKFFLIGAIAVNIGVLAFFKIASRDVGFPVGISFYTFQTISYLIDVYRGLPLQKLSFVKMAVYITMFPRLVSGPIVRYDEVSRELEARKFTMETIQEGLKIFTAGLALKVLLADPIGLLWNQANVIGYESISTALAWMAAAAYSMQIYFDFYGYSLMAIGLGQMLGFKLPSNFNHPYMARGVRDFYRRWHMTLGSWFRDYVYIPLGGNRKSEVRTILNLLAVWILTGLWHGITPNYLIWGLLLWLLIVIERWAGHWIKSDRIHICSRLYLWFVIPITWMCLAITDISQLQIYLGRMFGIINGINVNKRDWLRLLIDYKWLLVIGIIACTPLLQHIYQKLKDSWYGQLFLAILFWICVLRVMTIGENPFMYFKF